MYLSFASNTTELFVNVTYVYNSFEMWHFPRFSNIRLQTCPTDVALVTQQIEPHLYCTHIMPGIVFSYFYPYFWQFLFNNQCDRMVYHCSTGVAGMDLYAFDENSSAWRWTSTTHTQGHGLTASNSMATTRVCSSDTCKLTRYRLHLPLYNGVAKLSLGFNAEGAGCSNNHCVLVPDTDPRTLATESKPPVVWYGTSIAQGGVASRPGMAFTNSIARNIDRTVLNFGFSGNGIMEVGVAQWLVQIKAAAYVIDCNW